MSYRLTLISYWILFIVAPVAASFFFIGFNSKSVEFNIVFLLILLTLGSRGFRHWKRFLYMREAGENDESA